MCCLFCTTCVHDPRLKKPPLFEGGSNVLQAHVDGVGTLRTLFVGVEYLGYTGSGRFHLIFQGWRRVCCGVN